MASLFPPVGSWYEELASNKQFEVVAVDDKNRTVEIQYQDGDVTEFDIESWGRLNVIRIAGEEMDVAIGFDIEETFDDDSLSQTDFNSAIDKFDSDSYGGYDDYF